MKKSLFVSFFLFFFTAFLSAFSKDDVKKFTLESGLKLYFLEDTTTAPVRFELNINAGFQNQDEKNGGFFELYAALLNLEINTDTVRTVRTVAPGEAESTFAGLSRFFTPVTVSDSELRTSLNERKNLLNEFSSSAAGFINTAIDAEVFANSPWRQESGVNPKVFTQISPVQARSILEEIGKKYYTPSNASLYISGNITEGAVLELARKYFGTSLKQGTDTQPPVRKEFTAPAGKRKYVLSDDELSRDITQIVVQYTGFTPSQADILSYCMNRDYSPFKKLLLKQKNLAIMAGEYINVASAQTKNSSRLIIQSILEKTKVSPVVQSELFLEISRHAERFSQEDFNREGRRYESYFQELSDNSSLLMEALAEWNSHSDSDFFSRSQTLSSQNAAELEISYLEQAPFVFVLVNSAVYARYEKEFKKQGYTLITRKTAPWYERQKYRDFFRAQNVKPEKSDADSDIRNASLKFIKENRAQISGFTLTNGIPVTVKKTPSSNTTAVMLTISGGELLFADKTPGLCSLLTNALAANMRRLIDELYSQGVLSSTVNVTARTTAEYSVLTVTCPSDQVNECLSLMSRAIIYSDISPALADGIAYDLRTQWRMQTGNPEFQLLCEAVRMMYSKPYVNLFKDKEDKPAAMEFTQISSSYPLLLDSTRFSLVIAGGTTGDESLTTALNSTFGVLGTTAQTHSTGSGVSKPSVPRKSKKVQLRHQFFTDISADKAGPRPAVLVPTTDFSDPLIYIFECPDLSSTDLALFNSLLYELQDRLQKKLPGSQTVKAVPPSDDFPFAQIRITKIRHTAETDRLYAQTVEELTADLENMIISREDGIIDLEKDRLLASMENRWIMNSLSETSGAAGTAGLIQNGMMHRNAFLYLDQYEAVTKAGANDYYIIAKAYFDKTPALRMYSSDSKK